MSDLPEKLSQRIKQRKAQDSLRSLKSYNAKYDFSSNDYLGLARNSDRYFEPSRSNDGGATGSRLLTGNHRAHDLLEELLCEYSRSEAALVYNSGYDANLGLIAAACLRGDLILFDSLVHASIRDGIQLAKAKALKFAHNDLEHLNRLLIDNSSKYDSVYVVTESVFSMDGDSPDLSAMVTLCEDFGAHLIVDEAHAIGVFGQRGAGLVQHLKLHKRVFARIITFGKAVGYHGAAVLGGKDLIEYLINFSRSFIYTTALPAQEMQNIKERVHWIQKSGEYLEENQKLHRNIALLRSYTIDYKINDSFVTSESAIQSCIIGGNSRVKSAAKQLQDQGFGVLPILAPTVPEGQERLRICLHSYNTEEEIEQLIKLLASFLQS